MKVATYFAPTMYLILLVLAFLLKPTYATKNSYVVYMGAHGYTTQATPADYDRATQSHYDILGSFLGSSDSAKEAIFYSYTKHINGFAATIDDEVAYKLSAHPDVVSVFLNRVNKLHTTRSWDFLGLKNNGNVYDGSLWNKAKFGQDIIIGNLDTGVWPESKSFSDEEIGPIPSKWKGNCQKGSDSSFRCNRKLIGARYFDKGYKSDVGSLINSTFVGSPRDNNGHGTHTLSIAGGNFVDGANAFGHGNGTAKGGSPSARVAAYKVCWPIGGCYDADILAAFDAAIDDGVDVLSVSMSLGGDLIPFHENSIDIGSFHAVKNNIVVVCSAGNSGPDAGSVRNVAPWQITVGASTMDRKFSSYVILGNKMRFEGESLSDKSMLPETKMFPIISARNAKAPNATAEEAGVCKAGSLDSKLVKGKILVCLRGETDRLEKGEQAALAGAVGMVLANDRDSGNDIISDPHVLPATHINYKDGIALFTYINSTMSALARITKPATQLGTKPAPLIPSFSSVGPNPIVPEILKVLPDISAPGVNIIAAYTEATSPTEEDFDKRRVKFNCVTGTSMACPHIAGVVGLLKAVHPNWSPAAIKSAIITTASTWDNTWKPITNESHLKATPFDYGGGLVQPNHAMDPGLVYDLSTIDYLSLLCTLGYNETQIQLFSEKTNACPSKPISLVNFNYPAITVPSLVGTVTVTRRVKNVDTSSSVYNSFVECPVGMSIRVEPKTLKFESIGEEKVFKVVIRAKKQGGKKGYVFGKLTWCDGRHIVRSHIAVNLGTSV